jgi:AcrR family transcriptional regulator
MKYERGILTSQSKRGKRDTSGKQPYTAILNAAADLIIERGSKEIDISELAKRANVTRAAVYATFGGQGQRDSVRVVIYRSILEEFLKAAGESIQLGLGIIDQQTPTPGEQLAAILRATLIAFKENQHFGKVVLQELNLKHPEENSLIRPIFKNVDKVIDQARSAKQLSGAAPQHNWQIRQILFVLTRGLLRTLYLDQFDTHHKAFDKPELTEKDVEIQILRMLELYSSKDSQDQIEQMIGALDQRKQAATKTQVRR